MRSLPLLSVLFIASMTIPLSTLTVEDSPATTLSGHRELGPPSTHHLRALSHSIAPVDIVPSTINTATPVSLVPNVTPSLAAALGAIGSAVVSITASIIYLPGLVQSGTPLRAENKTATEDLIIAARTDAGTTPSTNNQYMGVLNTRNFTGLLGLMAGNAAVLLTIAITCRTAATTITAKSNWDSAESSLFTMVFLAVIAAIGETTATLFVGRSMTPDDRNARRVTWRKWVKISIRCIAIVSLFLLLAGLGCMKFTTALTSITAE